MFSASVYTDIAGLASMQLAVCQGAHFISQGHQSDLAVDERAVIAQDVLVVERAGVKQRRHLYRRCHLQLTREVKTLRVEVNEKQRRFESRSPAMAAELTDHIWSIKSYCGGWFHQANQLKTDRPPNL